MLVTYRPHFCCITSLQVYCWVGSCSATAWDLNTPNNHQIGFLKPVAGSCVLRMGALRSPLCSTSRTRHSGSASQPACSWSSSPWVWRGTSGGLSLTLRYDTHLPLSCPGLHFPTSDLQISVFSAFADCEVHCFRSDWHAYQPVSSCWPAEWLGDLLCDLVAESDVHCALWYKTCMSRWLELLWILEKRGNICELWWVNVFLCLRVWYATSPSARRAASWERWSSQTTRMWTPSSTRRHAR